MSTDLREEIRKAIGRCGLAGKGLLVAVSGGLDSVCLARLLNEEEALLEIAHVDHGLRPGSREDARFVEALADDLGSPFHSVRLAPEAFRPGRSVQAEARRLRRAFFEETLGRRDLAAIALAHHADDQAETVLLKCLRGAGPRGASAMREWDPPYIRPLLSVPRSRLAEEAARRGWAHREDPSNLSPRFTRNRVRRELLPLAEDIFGDGAARALCRFAAILREDEEFLSRLAEDAFASHARVEPEGLRFSVAGMAGLPPALRRRVWLAASERLGGEPRELGFAHLAAVEDLLEEGRAHRVAPAPGGVRFVRSFDDLWAVGARWLAPPAAPWAAGGVCAKADLPHGSLAAPLAAGRPMGEISWRGRLPGDRLAAGGRERKVKDLLMEARIPRWRRDRALVAEDGAGIAALFAPGRAWGCGETASAETWAWVPADGWIL